VPDVPPNNTGRDDQVEGGQVMTEWRAVENFADLYSRVMAAQVAYMFDAARVEGLPRPTKEEIKEAILTKLKEMGFGPPPPTFWERLNDEF